MSISCSNILILISIWYDYRFKIKINKLNDDDKDDEMRRLEGNVERMLAFFAQKLDCANQRCDPVKWALYEQNLIKSDLRPGSLTIW